MGEFMEVCQESGDRAECFILDYPPQLGAM
jgi:hypothetical protein